MLNKVIALAAMLTVCGQALAHDFWLQPAQFKPDNGAVLGIQIRVGDGFPGESRPRDPTKLVQFFVVGPEGREDVAGVDGRDPAGLMRLKSVGVHVIGYASSPTKIELEGDKFDSYLKEEGLDHVIEERTKRGEIRANATEAYSRCAKSIICCEHSNAAEVWKKPVSFKVEMIPDADPYSWSVGSEASFVLLAEGKPVEGALVFLGGPKVERSARLSARTDKEGRVKFEIPDSGEWLLTTVRMERASEGEDVMWKSTWASLTFEVPGPDTKGPAGQPIPKVPPAATPAPKAP